MQAIVIDVFGGSKRYIVPHLFASYPTDYSHTPFLQRVFSYLLGIVESKMKDLKLLVKELMDRLGTNWLDYGVGIMHLVTPVVVTSGPSQDLRFELCRALLESLLSPLDSTAVLKRWQWDDSSLPTRMMALSFVALQQVRPSVVQGGQEGPRCLAVIELALNLFQMALPQTRDVRYSLRGPLEEFGHVMQDLADKSNSWVLSDSHFLRFHYYLLCFKQVPRLEAPIAPRQSSIDSFFEAVK